MDGEPIPERLAIETTSLAVRRARRVSGMVGLGAFASFLFPIAVYMVAGGVFGMSEPLAWDAILSASWIGGMFAAALAGYLRTSESARPGRIEVAGAELTLVRGARHESFAPGSVLGGSVTPRAAGALLTMSLGDGRVASAFVPSEDAGRRALEALHVDPMGRALVGRFQSGLTRSFAGLGVAFALILLGAWVQRVVALPVAGGLIWTAVSLASVVGWLVGTRAPEIAVGADGVRIRGRIGARFIALDRIASVKVETLDALVLALTDGTVVRTHIALGNGPMLAAVVHRIELAKKLAAGSGGATLDRRLGRGERSFTAWREALRTGARTADYRSASVDGLDVARLVGAAGASAEHRIGAALVLREAGGDDGRERIRIAAEQCVSPRVRIALETIARDAEDEEAAVEAALAAHHLSRTR